MEEKFTWVETYGVLAKTLRNYRHRQDELLEFINELQADGFPTISTTDKDELDQSIPLAEIDPFTFFANFNRSIKTETRIEIIRRLIEKWGLSCPIPADFAGIPVVNPQRSWFIRYKKDRDEKDVDKLWSLFEEALDRRIQADTFNSVLNLKFIHYNITMGLFWIAPEEYLNLDNVNRDYLARKGIVPPMLQNYAVYFEYMRKTRDQIGKPFYIISHDAWLEKTQNPGNRNAAENETPEEISYWWLNANPKIWDPISPAVGTREIYTSHNAKGNKRRVYKYFQQVKPGDLLVGYVTLPIRQVAALFKVTKPLHNGPEGEAFEIEKVEQFPAPISFRKLQTVPELVKCEPLINNQGSLFRLTPDEYEVIRGIIDEENEPFIITMEFPPFTGEQCAKSTGLSVSKIEDWRSAIERKGQAIFYGPPGTGKTFIADHIARHIVGGGTGFVELIQFHPAYAYEEFMQGIRPDTDEKGGLLFELKPGRFLSFCKRAQLTDSPCVLIIDEINRANLSRVFGELMYLLEYRDKEIQLANGVNFSIPSNVRIIGTMNTADRSIALVDFALRRRFAFIELCPEYDLLKNFQAKQGFNADGLVSVLHEINTKINDKNFSLGISFFMVHDLPDKIEQIWRMEIETYLEEYFFAQPETVNAFRWEKIRGKIEP